MTGYMTASTRCMFLILLLTRRNLWLHTKRAEMKMRSAPLASSIQWVAFQKGKGESGVVLFWTAWFKAIYEEATLIKGILSTLIEFKESGRF